MSESVVKLSDVNLVIDEVLEKIRLRYSSSMHPLPSNIQDAIKASLKHQMKKHSRPSLESMV